MPNNWLWFKMYDRAKIDNEGVPLIYVQNKCEGSLPSLSCDESK